MARENNSIFWMFAFVIFFFWILTKHVQQKSNAVTQKINVCAQGVAIPANCSVPGGYQIVPIPMAVSPTLVCCGTPAPILRILAAYKSTGTIKPTCALTLCFYNKYLAATPCANNCQKLAFAIISNEAANNSVSNAPISCMLKSVLQNLTGTVARGV